MSIADLGERIAVKKKIVDKQLQEVQYLQLMVDTLTTYYPTMPFIDISVHSAYAFGFVVLNANTLNEAMEMAERMNPLNIVKVQSSCTSFKPEMTLTPEDKIQANITSIGPWYYKISGIKEYKEEKTLHWFIYLENLLIEIRCLVLDDSLTKRKKKNEGKSIENCDTNDFELVNASGFFPCVTAFATNNDQPRIYILY